MNEYCCRYCVQFEVTKVSKACHTDSDYKALREGNLNFMLSSFCTALSNFVGIYVTPGNLFPEIRKETGIKDNYN